jgi:hypothetical protein
MLHTHTEHIKATGLIITINQILEIEIKLVCIKLKETP